MQQGHIIVTTLLQTWVSLSATRSYHCYNLVAVMDFAQCNKVISLLRPCCRHGFRSVQQGRIIVTTLLQSWISLSATRSYHCYNLVAVMDFAQCNKVISLLRPCCRHGFRSVQQGRIFLQSSRMNAQNLWKRIRRRCAQYCQYMQMYALLHNFKAPILIIQTNVDGYT